MPTLLDSRYERIVRSRISDRPVEVLDVQLVECLKYLAIVSMTPGRRIPVTPDVDVVWHELLLQTSQYRSLCRSFPGGGFLDHESIDPESYNERVGDHAFVTEWLQWVPDYVQSFGDFTEQTAQHWNVVRFLTDEIGLSLDDVNSLGRASAAEAVVPAGSPWSALS
jgi:hypothetical protein